MLASRKEQIKKQFRRKQFQKTMQQYRQKNAMLAQLTQLLAHYKGCSLVSGDEDQHGHNSYLKCLDYVINQNEQIFNLVGQIGVEDCKELLLRQQLPFRLRRMTETIQLDRNQGKFSFSTGNTIYYSISDIVSLLSQDDELSEEYGVQAATLLSGQFRRTTLQNKKETNHEQNAVIGMVNLFSNVYFVEAVYDELRDFNFQFYMQKYLTKYHREGRVIMNGQPGQSLLLLLRYYLQYQLDYTEKVINPSFQRILGSFIPIMIHKNLIIDQKVCLSLDADNFIDELLYLSTFVRLQHQEQLEMMRCPLLYRKKYYALLLDCYSKSYPEMMKIEVFNDIDLQELLEVLKQIQHITYFESYLENLSAALVTMLMGSQQQQLQVNRLGNYLNQTRTLELFEKEEDRFDGCEMLIKLLEQYSKSCFI